MPKYIKTLLFVCLLHTLCSGQTYFSNYYKTGYHNYFSTNVFPQADSSHVVFNYIQDSATGRQDLALLKIDKTGLALIKKPHNFANVNYLAYLNGLRQFIPATNTSFFATAVTYTASNATILFSKINKSTLDTIKTTFYYDGNYSYYLNSFLKIHDNKYFLIGNKSNSNSQWPCVFHVDSNLNITNTYTLSNVNNLTTVGALYDATNKKIVINTRKNNQSNSPNVTLLLCDTLLNVLNTVTYTTVLTNGVVQVVYSAFDNTYITVGALQTSTYGGSYSLYRLQLCKYDSNLNFVWRKTYGSAILYNMLSDAVIESDGSIVACGIYSDSTSTPLMNYDTKGIILKTNSNGDSIWMRQYNNYVTGSYPANYWETFYGVEKTLDGGYILCGNVLNRPQDRAWIVKTDSTGCIYSGCGSIITSEKEDETIKDEFGIYPNPANDFVFIKSHDQSGEKYSVCITDVSGKALKNFTLSNDRKISLAEFNSGIYFVNIYANERLITSKKLAVIK